MVINQQPITSITIGGETIYGGEVSINMPGSSVDPETGEITLPSGGSGTRETFTLSASDISNKYILVASNITVDENTVLKIATLPDLYYGSEFVVDGVNKKMIKSHRLSYELHIGRIPRGVFVLHKCDNGLCVNPNHLFLGSQNDNMKDCAIKGRTSKKKGSLNGNSKLTWNDVKDIRLNCQKGHKEFGMSSFARKYNVTPQTVWGILHNKNWTHL